MPRYVYVKEAALYLHVSQQTLRNWDASGYLPAQRTPTGQRLWNMEDLEALRAARAQTTTALLQTSPGPAAPPSAASIVPTSTVVADAPSHRYRHRLDTEDQNRFTVARSRPNQSSVIDEIALVEVYIEHLLDRLTAGGDMGGLWPALNHELEQFQRARAQSSTVEMHTHMTKMEDLIQRGAGEHHVWTKLGVEIDRLRMLRHAEHKRQIDTHMLVPMEESLGLLGQVIQMIQQTMLQMIGDDARTREIFAVISHQFDTILESHLSDTESAKKRGD